MRTRLGAYYGTPNDKILIIKINVCKLMKFLNDFSVQANIKIYVGKIIYDLSRKEIERIQNHAKYLQVVLYKLFAH